ncbi:AN1-type zinc finger protein 1 [Leucoagaricus sp. SymC.cos]|nr:AN1-type zinc finger protein 1 [Leucoagaricus sp. SymC.cos]
MDASLLDVGSQCSLDSCSTVDFLPILCNNCRKYFCKDHIHSTLHACPPSAKKPEIQHDRLKQCALEDCHHLSLDAYSTAEVACTKCNQSFCVEHRHPTSHKCNLITTSMETTASRKSEKARALLAKISSTSSARKPIQKRVAKHPTDPVKLAAIRKVEVMKMRHQAVSLDPKDKSAPPLDQRMYVKIRFGSVERIYWMRKACPMIFLIMYRVQIGMQTIIGGKAIDLLSDQLGIKHNSSSVGSEMEDKTER